MCFSNSPSTGSNSRENANDKAARFRRRQRNFLTIFHVLHAESKQSTWLDALSCVCTATFFSFPFMLLFFYVCDTLQCCLFETGINARGFPTHSFPRGVFHVTLYSNLINIQLLILHYNVHIIRHRVFYLYYCSSVVEKICFNIYFYNFYRNGPVIVRLWFNLHTKV